MARRRRRSVITSTRHKQQGRPLEPTQPKRPAHPERIEPLHDWTHPIVAAWVVVVVAMVYVFTAARDIVLGDTPELMTAAITLGVPHAPGYPLFSMLGHLFSLVP